MGGAGRDRKRGMESSSWGWCRERLNGALTFFYMLKLMERNKCCHQSFSPLSGSSAHTHTRANVVTRSLLPSPERLLFLSISSSALRQQRSSPLLNLGLLNALSAARCDSTVCLLLVGGDLGKERQRIPLHPRQPGESSQHETGAQHNSVKEKYK